jgi:hypothetical protein
MKKHLAILASAGLVAAMSIALPGLAADQNKGSFSAACGSNGTITASPTVLWPPNHQDVQITFTYTDNDAAEAAQSQKLTITPNLHDEVVDNEELVGSGNTPFLTDSVGGTATDTDGSVDVVGTARAERSGTGDGRVYEFDYTADDGTLDGCKTDPAKAGDGILVSVPHDCRAVEGGNSACNDN